jgi:CoA:oxalate CoA-transferase
MERALPGIRVLDLSHVLAGSLAAMILADLGAEVIHIESPRGDEAREYGPFVGETDKDRSGYFISLNRNKQGMVLDLKQEKGKEILRALIRVGDVIVENFRPGTMTALGFGWEEIRRINPGIIYASISGFGHDALPEYASRPAYDIVAQAYSGLMSITGPEGGPPCRAGTSVGDIVAGHQAAIGILAALVCRGRTGRGQHYDGAMVDGLFATLENAVVRYSVEGKVPQPLGTAHPFIIPFQAFQTRDDWMVIPIGSDRLAADPRFMTNPRRNENRGELISTLSDQLRLKTSAEWVRIFEKEGIPYSPVNNMQQICEDPHIQHRQMLVEIEQAGIGRMKIAGSPFRLSETPGRVYAGAPRLGEHTEAVLTRVLKLSSAEIQALKEEGVING